MKSPPPSPRKSPFPSKEPSAALVVREEEASAGRGRFSYNAEFNSSAKIAMEDSMFSSLWHFAGKQSIELDFSFTSSNLASLTIPVLLFWIVDKLNLMFIPTFLQYASFVVISARISYSIDVYINEVTKAFQNLNPFRKPMPRRYCHVNSESWELLNRSRRRISEVQVKTPLPSSDEEDDESFNNTPVVVDEVSEVVDGIVDGISVNEEKDEIIFSPYRDFRKERREVFALLHKSKRRLDHDFQSVKKKSIISN